MKYEWRKSEKDIYLPKEVSVLDLPTYSYITISGKGNPNEQEFSDRISTLYPVAYNLRMALKKGVYTEPFEYTVYPLEGVWTTSDGSRDEYLNKDALVYKIMIRQPDQVTKEMFEESINDVKSKKDLALIDDIKFEQISDGKVIEILHKGPFETEIESFKIMEDFMEQNNLTRNNIMEKYAHREIYLSDFRKVDRSKLKTTLRYSLN
ncbi:GyrI-like domain-containing protein [Companilactobacillus metriopterae]|uniref:GyrI-like domain-containing protein n=1 Tax=Companilactobacillus metriopterae TaxID=1909267 RepID=UPI00100BD3B9|nr:GyrI-like domain-containing protein [Companilactobacillus metriopterae]